jgi:hypothetical protein
MRVLVTAAVDTLISLHQCWACSPRAGSNGHGPLLAQGDIGDIGGCTG